MGLDGNVSNGILYELARVKEQKNNLAVQLSKHVDQNKELQV